MDKNISYFIISNRKPFQNKVEKTLKEINTDINIIREKKLKTLAINIDYFKNTTFVISDKDYVTKEEIKEEIIKYLKKDYELYDFCVKDIDFVKSEYEFHKMLYKMYLREKRSEKLIKMAKEEMEEDKKAFETYPELTRKTLKDYKKKKEFVINNFLNNKELLKEKNIEKICLFLEKNLLKSNKILEFTEKEVKSRKFKPLIENILQTN